MSTRSVYCILLCVIIWGFTVRPAYREIYFRFRQENTSLRLRHAGGYSELASKEEHEARRYRETLRIQDVVLLSENELLLLIPFPSTKFMDFLPPKSILRCLLSREITAQVTGIDYLQGRAAIRCQTPFPGILGLAAFDQVRLISEGSDLNLLSLHRTRSHPVRWDWMVYESLVTDTDVILFAKGINQRQGINAAPHTLRCVFNNTVETTVTVSAQEIFRCENPPHNLQLSGAKVSLQSVEETLPLPSVAYYHNRPTVSEFTLKDKSARKLLCACTMVYNAAKFLKEWIVYHSFLGVEAFLIYDNNSDDDLEDVIKSVSMSGYNVRRHPWPWAKTQEAGFAHCALQGREECQWMMFTDVDEFIFSRHWLRRPSSNALKILLTNKTHEVSNSSSMIGQVSMNCRNFGPSNLKEHPPRGVTQGYTCRQKLEQRHKSIVLLDALPSSLLNVIHHFELKPGYRSIRLQSHEAVINHYKYQAWSEFKAKFRRRVSAYVVDWKESKRLSSQDRVPGLGYKAVEPAEWDKMFCEVNDTAMLRFTTKVFSVQKGSIPLMQWQL
uniref:Glycosyltransferase family 92 protein n=1 Tax=Araucaria cunninghamii TaxID=56994 RepID=A0A0D6QS33_ARACU